MNREVPDVQDGFRKGRRTRDQIANIHWIMEKARKFQKMSTSALLTMPKPLTLLDHLTCLLRNLHADQEAAVRIRQGTTDWFQIGKGVRQGCILSLCLFNFYAEFIEMPGWMKHKLES